ncbi:hypothetical protein BD779DRAFT_1673662 [Infundibulicybe gibba]|nr:hypothetical protein BD779DRAFT_1673662 [Infundibulicybe gibba]
MDRAFRAHAAQFAGSLDDGSGRPLSELVKTKETLKGFESQRLRSFCTSNYMEPSRDLDAYGNVLASGDLALVQSDHSARLAKPGATLESVAADIYAMRWGPTEVPVYNLLNLLAQIFPPQRPGYIAIAAFLISGAQVPVDAPDLSGTTALSHSISTKPSFDTMYATMLYEAGGDINHRNRYGGTVSHEIAQVYQFGDAQKVRTALAAMEWFLAHGGSIDIADGDGASGRFVVESLKTRVPKMAQLVLAEDARRAALGDKCCWLCGRQDRKLLACGRCKAARYCEGRTCQKLQWPKHKKGCKAP